jgi:thiol-disulfide isomerase/thioredoxin
MTPLRPLVLGAVLAALVSPPLGAAFAEEPAGEAAEVNIPWVRDWNAALAEAKKDGKDLLIDFTGSDWCGWCKRLDAEVFGQAAFLEKATKQFVMVFLDFPRDPELKKAVVDAKLNERLNKEFGVQGFPTIVLATAEGLPYARTGYRDGGPEGYLTHLDELRASGDKVKALVAKGKTDMAAFKPGFEVLAEGGFLTVPAYAWTLDHVAAKDADGALGLKPLAARVQEEGALKALMQGVRSREDVPWQKLFEFLKGSQYLAGQPLIEYSVGTGDWLVEQKRYEDAKAMFQLPLRDPDISSNARAKAFLDERLAKCAPPAEEPAEKPTEEPAEKPVEPAPADPK